MTKLRFPALAALATFALAAPAFAQQQQQPPPPAKQESVAEAARKAKEKKGAQATKKPAKSYDNDNLPTSGKINVVGEAREGSATTQGAAGTQSAAAGTQGAAGAATEERGEEYWRARFSEARGKVAAAEKELDVLQRELNLLSVQYYSDPQKALKEQTERTEINEHRKKIEAKQKEVADLKAAVTALEDELRAAGGNAGWSRP